MTVTGPGVRIPLSPQKGFFDIKKKGKNMEIILAFGLGIMLVSTIVLVYVVLKSNKKVNELSHLERNIEDIYRTRDEQNGDIHRELDKINGKIDSRVDKLYDNISRELEETNRKVEFLRKSLGKDYF